MLDFFSIFSKGGIVLWCFQGTSDIFTPSINALIRSVLLQERSGNETFQHNNYRIQYKLDNEYELVFVGAYQKFLQQKEQFQFVDKLLNDVYQIFREKYRDFLRAGSFMHEFDFGEWFNKALTSAETWAKKQSQMPKQMRTFEESAKSKKTVSSMIEKKDDKENKKPAKKEMVKILEPPPSPKSEEDGAIDEEILVLNRQKLVQRLKKKDDKKEKSPKQSKEGKKPRVWDLGGTAKDLEVLDRTRDKSSDTGDTSNFVPDKKMVGQMVGRIRELEVEEEEEFAEPTVQAKQGRGMFSMLQGLVGSKAIERQDLEPALDKMRDHLISKNVAADIAGKLCDSVAVKLEGKVLGTFDRLSKTVSSTLHESLVQILSPKRRIDILRDAMEAKASRRPYVMTFCGVNGVGKSTNLAKICFWLIENGLRVLIAACDTFRAGAVEQLRTHMRHLNTLHAHSGEQMVQLYEKGYGKDAAGIAMEAICYARDCGIDVVLVDTAGRMQDNEPLMRALAKLIKVNSPDLVLFVGEALVGNEAVDQLVKFNQALADYSGMANPHQIDGIVLTKFDTIDDKVGAAISMTYITGQPIVFVGTGQTYTDLKNLNAKAVVAALMK